MSSLTAAGRPGPLPREPLLLTFTDAAALLGVSYRTVRRLVYGGELTSVNVRGARRVTVESIYRYHDRLIEDVGALGVPALDPNVGRSSARASVPLMRPIG